MPNVQLTPAQVADLLTAVGMGLLVDGLPPGAVGRHLIDVSWPVMSNDLSGVVDQFKEWRDRDFNGLPFLGFSQMQTRSTFKIEAYV